MKIKHEDWNVEINNNLLIVEKYEEAREYDLPEWKECEHVMEYIYLTLLDDSLLQFKMEVDDFWVGDKFDSQGEFIEPIACHVFGLK
jgi:hypothetical protein